MEQSVEYNSLEKIKVKASLTLSILFAHISDFFLKKEKKKNSQKIQQAWTWESFS